MKKMLLILAAICLLATAVLGVIPTVAAENAEVLYGDANKDGRVNLRDVGLLQQYVANWSVTIDEVASDVNNDGRVNLRDVGLLQQYVANWSVTLGPQDPVTPPEDNEDIFNDTELEWP